jgi:Na+-transporting NADH:ubiquinone oxidoreductase subunit A
MLSSGIIVAIVIILLFVLLLLTLGESLLKLSAKQAGVSESEYSVMPMSLRSLLGVSKRKPSYIPEEEPVFFLKEGFSINLMGAPSLEQGTPSVRVATYSIKPIDFIGLSPIPKMMVEEKAHVKAGDPLFFDKSQPDAVFAAPVSGEVVEIRRGPKRAIHEIIILADQGEMQYRKYELPNLETATREELVAFLLGSGFWPFLRQRPFDVLADPTQTPKGIFISTFDTAPLAPDLNLAVAGKEATFQKGLDVLTKLCPKVHLGLSANGSTAPAAAFTEAKGVHKHWFNGPHPSGNVGVQIHHIDPINMGEVVWTLTVHSVLVLGTLFEKGIFDTERLVAVVGAELKNPGYARVHQGANIKTLVETAPAETITVKEWIGKDVKEKDASGKETSKWVKEYKEVTKTAVRFVSGDVLTGTKIARDGHLGFHDDQVTVLKEGNYYELFGWLLPQTGHPTISRTFPGGFVPDAQYEADTNTNGEKRAFVVTGQYEAVLPMDIYPQHLFRAILSNDFDKMIGLGLLELTEEDVALCEYVCTSKQPLQAILRQGLDNVREQG